MRKSRNSLMHLCIRVIFNMNMYICTSQTKLLKKTIKNVHTKICTCVYICTCACYKKSVCRFCLIFFNSCVWLVHTHVFILKITRIHKCISGFLGLLIIWGFPLNLLLSLSLSLSIYIYIYIYIYPFLTFPLEEVSLAFLLFLWLELVTCFR